MTVLRVRTPAPGGASYSDAVVVQAAGARWIYVAGQTPRARPDEDAPPADLGGQTERCFDQIDRILHEHGSTLADIVQLTTYITDLGRYSEFAEVRGRLFASDPPSSAAVGVASLLDDALVEIVAVAVTEAGPLG